MARKATKTAKAATRNSKRTEANSTRKARVAKPTQPKGTVPGWPNIKVREGKGTGPDTIAAVIAANNGQTDMAVTNDGSAHVCDKHLAAGIVCKAGVNWATAHNDYLAMQRREAEAAKHPAVMARGTDSRTAPHSAKAVADGRKAKAGAPAADRAQKKADKEAAKTAKKAERKAKAAPKADDTRKLTIADKKFTFGGEGTARRACWDAAVKVAKAKGTAADYIAAGGKAKYLPRWVSAGAIKLA